MMAHQGWRQLEDSSGRPFLLFEAFCCARQPFGLGYDAADIDRICRERLSAQARSQAPKTLSEWGEIGRGRDRDVGHISTPLGTGRADYTIALLKRDHPAILKRMQGGEFPSVAAAARAAGIHRAYPKVTPTPKGFLKAIRKHLAAEQITELVRLLGGGE